LVPVNQIKPIPSEGPCKWVSSGEDPQFYLPAPLPANWVILHYIASAEEPIVFKLYIDSGDGFQEEQSFKIGSVTENEKPYSVILPLGPKVTLLRLDPGEKPVKFVLKDLRITQISRLEILLRSIWSRIQIKRNFSIHVILKLLFAELKQMIRIFRKEGYKKCQGFLLEKITSEIKNTNNYELWMKSNNLESQDIVEIESNVLRLLNKPLFSIVVRVLNVDIPWAKKTIDSVLDQIYPNWELLLVVETSEENKLKTYLKKQITNDTRIVVVSHESNNNQPCFNGCIFSQISGKFVCTINPGDEISPDALYEFAWIVNRYPDTDMIYSDEDQIDKNGKRFAPFFKPDWSPEYFESYFYTSQFSCYRRNTAKKINGFRNEFKNAQVYDFVLRFVEKSQQIKHISKILYHNREVSKSNLSKESYTEFGVKALEDKLKRIKISGKVTPVGSFDCFNVQHNIIGYPLISVIIPSAGKTALINSDEIDLLSNCINNIKEKTKYRNFEIIVVDNNDLKRKTIDAICDIECKFVHYTEEFNVAKKMNLGATYAKGEYLLFLNDDIEINSPDWLKSMLQFIQRPDIGVVGAKLYFEDESIQHVGVTFIDGFPDHIYRGYPKSSQGYYFSSIINRNYLAVTGACLMTSKAIFESVNGFNENFPINYNDVDYCLKVNNLNYRIVYTSHAELFHYESKCRARYVDPREIDLFEKLWRSKTLIDPYYSIHLETRPPNFEIKT